MRAVLTPRILWPISIQWAWRAADIQAMLDHVVQYLKLPVESTYLPLSNFERINDTLINEGYNKATQTEIGMLVFKHTKCKTFTNRGQHFNIVDTTSSNNATVACLPASLPSACYVIPEARI